MNGKTILDQLSTGLADESRAAIDAALASGVSVTYFDDALGQVVEEYPDGTKRRIDIDAIEAAAAAPSESTSVSPSVTVSAD